MLQLKPHRGQVLILLARNTLVLLFQLSPLGEVHSIISKEFSAVCVIAKEFYSRLKLTIFTYDGNACLTSEYNEEITVCWSDGNYECFWIFKQAII